MTTQTLDASRGTALWAFNSFRQDALSQLLKDLLSVEKTGIDIEKCEKVQTSLREISITASAIPDGTFFSKAIWKDIEDFKDIYVRWNDIKNNDPIAIEDRKVTLGDLKVKRHKIAKKARKHQHVLASDVTLQAQWHHFPSCRCMFRDKGFCQISCNDANMLQRVGRLFSLLPAFCGLAGCSVPFFHGARLERNG